MKVLYTKKFDKDIDQITNDKKLKKNLLELITRIKQAMKGFLPDEIITKSKHGMGLPVTPWFKQDKQMNTLLHDTLFSGTTALAQYFKPEFIQKMKTAFETDDTIILRRQPLGISDPGYVAEPGQMILILC